MVEEKMSSILVDVFCTGWRQEGHLASKFLHQLSLYSSVSSFFTAVPAPVWEGDGGMVLHRMHGERERESQCWSNASQHILIYLQTFTSYSEILVRNCNFFPPPCIGGVPIGIPGKSLDLRKLESWGYQAVKSEDSLMTGWAVSTQYQRMMDRQTDGQTDSL